MTKALSSATSAIPPAVQINLTYLEPGKPNENLKRLANAQFSTAPATACMTHQTFQKVPRYKPTPQKIRNWSYSFGFFTTLSGLYARAFGETILCASQENWQTDFFRVSSRCFVHGMSKLAEPSHKKWTFYNVSYSLVAGIAAYMAGRILLKDYRESQRFTLLDKEYSAVAEMLTQNFETAKKEKNSESVRNSQYEAEKLQANLPIIKAHLLQTARLSPEKIERLVQKLSLASHRVLNGGLR
jgi:hypothetical protein